MFVVNLRVVTRTSTITPETSDYDMNIVIRVLLIYFIYDRMLTMLNNSANKMCQGISTAHHKTIKLFIKLW